MKPLIIFAVLSIPIILISWKPLVKLNSHGFYRFFSWECILWLLVCNYSYWFDNPFGWAQVISWMLLLIAAYVVFAGIFMLKKSGKASSERQESELYHFEKTTELVVTGIYKYVRHPLYGSLLILTWGIFFKHITATEFLISIISSICLYYTVKVEEQENVAFFGDQYIKYMRSSKMFIPFIW